MTGEAAPVGSQYARAQLGLPGQDAQPGQVDDAGTVTLNRMVTLAFVMSLCGIVFWGCALVGLVLGLVARRSLADRGAPRRRMVTASIVVGAVPVVLGVIALLVVVVLVASG